MSSLSAVIWGGGDFYGGTAARRSAPIPATVVSSAVGLVVVLGGCVTVGRGSPSAGDLALGLGSGVFVGIALASFYASMTLGQMALVAPISALSAAAIPVAVGVAGGDSLTPQAWVAIVIGMVGIGFAAREPSEGEQRSASPTRAIVLALVAGVGFGIYMSLIAQARSDAGLWPLFASRVGSLASLVLAALVTRSTRMARAGIAPAVTAGGLDGVGNSVYLVATRHGPLAVIGTIGSMYPAATVVMAALIHGERPSRVQALGVVMLLVSVAMLGIAGT